MQTPEQFENPVYLTREGLEDLKKESEELENKYLPEVAKQCGDAMSDGDLAENAAYQDARERYERLVDEISEKKDILRRAMIISKENKGNIQLGSLVRLQKEGNDAIEEYSLVDSAEEANPLENKISDDSPLGKALMGKKKGENIKVDAPNGKINYTIIDVG